MISGAPDYNKFCPILNGKSLCVCACMCVCGIRGRLNLPILLQCYILKLLIRDFLCLTSLVLLWVVVVLWLLFDMGPASFCLLHERPGCQCNQKRSSLTRLSLLTSTGCFVVVFRCGLRFILVLITRKVRVSA